MREVRLYGHLGKRYGKVHRIDVKSPAEAISALRANFPDFEKQILKHNRPGYHVFVGKRSMKVDELSAWSGENVIKIVPAIEGAKRGFLQTIVGVALVAVGFVTGHPFLMKVGFALALGGVAQMLTKPPTSEVANSPENMPSYSFNGPVNTTAVGNAVSILYGELIVGSQVISAGLSADEMAIDDASNSSSTPSNGQTPWAAPYGGSFDRAYL